MRTLNHPASRCRKHLRRLLLPAVILVWITAPVLAASAVPTTSLPLEPTARQVQITRLINQLVSQYHYRHVPLDNALSGQILDQYLQALDPAHSYFLAQDLKQFESYRNQFDDHLRQANLDPAYTIFAVFRMRVTQRTDYALQLLDRKFDFTRDENYHFDRRKAPWATAETELDDLWRKRVKNDFLSLRLAGKNDAAIRDTLRKRYQQIARQTGQLNADDVFQYFMNAYMAALDPHSNYFSPRASENFQIRMRLSLEGIGAVLETDSEYTKVRRVVTGGPADLSGALHTGDRIVGVGQGKKTAVVDVIGWRLDDVVDLIRGAKGTIVRLDILPASAAPSGMTRTISVTRDTIKLDDQAAKKSIIEIPNGKRMLKIGVIDVPTFYADFEARARGDHNYRSTTRDVRKLLGELEADKVNGIIVDLRGDGGGALSEAISLTGLFIDSGPVVQVEDARGHIEVDRDPERGTAYSGPLAVLVDRNSASASEIFTAAIQDYHRGIIIGEPTFGKGTVQNLIPLDRFGHDDQSLGQLKITVAQFFRINGGSTQFRGVTPNIVLPTTAATDRYGEREFDNALPWSHIKPTRYTRFDSGLNNKIFQFLEQKHAQRVAADPKFTLLKAEVRYTDALQSSKTISLLESKRIKEYEALEQRKTKLEKLLGEKKPPADDTASGEPADNPGASSSKLWNNVLLDESGAVLGDYIVSARRLVADTDAPAAASGAEPATNRN